MPSELTFRKLQLGTLPIYRVVGLAERFRMLFLRGSTQDYIIKVLQDVPACHAGQNRVSYPSERSWWVLESLRWPPVFQLADKGTYVWQRLRPVIHTYLEEQIF